MHPWDPLHTNRSPESPPRDFLLPVVPPRQRTTHRPDHGFDRPPPLRPQRRRKISIRVYGKGHPIPPVNKSQTAVSLQTLRGWQAPGALSLPPPKPCEGSSAGFVRNSEGRKEEEEGEGLGLSTSPPLIPQRDARPPSVYVPSSPTPCDSTSVPRAVCVVRRTMVADPPSHGILLWDLCSTL